MHCGSRVIRRTNSICSVGRSRTLIIVYLVLRPSLALGYTRTFGITPFRDGLCDPRPVLLKLIRPAVIVFRHFIEGTLSVLVDCVLRPSDDAPALRRQYQIRKASLQCMDHVGHWKPATARWVI